MKDFENTTVETFKHTDMYDISVDWFGQPMTKPKTSGGDTWDLSKAKHHWKGGVSKHTGPVGRVGV